MIKFEQECPWMASAVFCFHRINCPEWESLVGKPQLSYRSSSLCFSFPCPQPQTTLNRPLPPEFCLLCTSTEKPGCRVFLALSFPLLLVYPLPSSVCVNSSAETDQTGRLIQAVQEELIRVCHWPWWMGYIG